MDPNRDASIGRMRKVLQKSAASRRNSALAPLQR
jgi:hypothetical protein